MNVLISSCFPHWNAEAAYAATLAEALRAAGHRALVLAPPGTRNAEELARRGLEPLTAIGRDAVRPWRWPAALRALRKLQAREGIEVVDVFRSAEFPLHLLAARGSEGPALVRTRGGAQPERRTWLNRQLYGPWCDGVIASAEVIRRRLGSRLGVPAERIRTIYYPVECPRLPDRETRRRERTRFLASLGLGEERLVLAVVGRIAPEKGHDALLEALRLLAASHPEALLLIANKGYPSEAPHRERLAARIVDLGLAERVIWLGHREDLLQVMGWVDVGVIPSIASEMNCRVAVEFFSAGTPVVALPTGALPEVVEHGTSGLVAASHDPAHLARELERLATDPALRERLGADARRQVEQRFSRARFLEATLAVFEQALARRAER